MYAKYLFIKNVFLSNFLRLCFPYKLTFALTYRCNLTCKTCFIWKKEQKDELSIGEIEKFFMKSNRFSWVDVVGGEIFLRSDLLNIFEIIFGYCHSLCIFHFSTNGQLTEKVIDTVKKMREFKKNMIFIITVSMDGPEKINDEIRGRRGAWLNSLNTFIALKKLGLKFVYLSYTSSKYNSGDLGDMLLAVKRCYPYIDYNDIHVNVAHTSEHYYNNVSLRPGLNDFPNKGIDDLPKMKSGIIKNFLERRYFAFIPNYLLSGQIPLKCQALASTCFIDPYGDLYPCTVYSRKILNIRDINYDLGSFWEEDAAAVIRKEILDRKCTCCWTPCEAYPAILGSMLNFYMRFKK